MEKKIYTVRLNTDNGVYTHLAYGKLQLINTLKDCIHETDWSLVPEKEATNWRNELYLEVDKINFEEELKDESSNYMFLITDNDIIYISLLGVSNIEVIKEYCMDSIKKLIFKS